MIMIFAIKVDIVNFRKTRNFGIFAYCYLLKYHNEWSVGSKQSSLELYRVTGRVQPSQL